MHRRARQAAGFVCVRLARDRIARQRGVGGDDAVDAMARQRVGDRVDLLLCQVGGDLHRQRHAALVLIFQRPALVRQLRQQRRQFVAALQRAQVLGVGR
ncbi:hypothetical protein G6F57_022009 [Rhizopus arrhizus]|nr:hypothetical protein G6F57_022009 [Rhizopus arrhizus]